MDNELDVDVSFGNHEEKLFRPHFGCANHVCTNRKFRTR